MLSVQEAAAGRLPSGNTGTSLSCAEANHYEVSYCVPTSSGGRTTDVGSYAPNAFGLYDMHGNILEWCLDRWDGEVNDQAGGVSDPLGTAGANRVVRGGCLWNRDLECRSSFRFWVLPDTGAIGFRVVLAPEL